MPKIFISYRHVEPDQSLAGFLVEHFRQSGLEVFIDRQMLTGTRWIEEIESQLRSSDFFVVLLSKDSIRSAMVRKEVWIAHELSQQPNRNFVILPVRANFTGALPYDLSAYLDTIQYAIWKDGESYDTVASQLLAAINHSVALPLTGKAEDEAQDPAAIRALAEVTEAAGAPLPSADPRFLLDTGAVKFDSPHYIRRVSDDKFEELTQQPIVKPSKHHEMVEEEPTLEPGKVMIDISPLIGMPGGRVKPAGLRPAVKWGGGLAVIVLAVATYVATKTTTTFPPTSLTPSGTTQPLPNLGEEFTENLNGVKLVMKRVPEGEFLMGSPENESYRYGNESPQHRVIVPSFYIGRTEVTQAQWKAVMDSNPSHFKSVKGDDLPVESVSWNDAKAFCQKLSEMTGKTYRLPSEAEWEYACRAATIGAYAGDFRAMAWYWDTSDGGKWPTAERKTHPVGRTQPNHFGLFDMHGNVWEWCEDFYHENYNGAPIDGSAWLSGGEQQNRVLRGGSWQSVGGSCRSAGRATVPSFARSNQFGVRVVLSSSILRGQSSGK